MKWILFIFGLLFWKSRKTGIYFEPANRPGINRDLNSQNKQRASESYLLALCLIFILSVFIFSFFCM